MYACKRRTGFTRADGLPAAAPAEGAPRKRGAARRRVSSELGGRCGRGLCGRLLSRDLDLMAEAAEEDAAVDVLVEAASEARSAGGAGGAERRVGRSDHDALRHAAARSANFA